jgi:hypothetical protein
MRRCMMLRIHAVAAEFDGRMGGLQLPATTSPPPPAKARHNAIYALFGKAATTESAGYLTKVAAERGYKSPYWVAKRHLCAFATSLKPTEAADTGVTVSAIDATLTRAPMWFNAEQTMHPERFTEDNCSSFPAFQRINGMSHDYVIQLVIRGHIIAHSLPRDLVWSTEDALAQRKLITLPSAVPLQIENRAQRCKLLLFGESMTSNPQLLLEIAARNRKIWLHNQSREAGKKSELDMSNLYGGASRKNRR